MVKFQKSKPQYSLYAYFCIYDVSDKVPLGRIYTDREQCEYGFGDCMGQHIVS